MIFEEFFGWLVIAAAMYFPGATIVAAAMTAIRAVRPEIRPPKIVLRTLNVGVALVLWFCIPLIVHARFGRADH